MCPVIACQAVCGIYIVFDRSMFIFFPWVVCWENSLVSGSFFSQYQCMWLLAVSIHVAAYIENVKQCLYLSAPGNPDLLVERSRPHDPENCLFFLFVWEDWVCTIQFSTP